MTKTEKKQKLAFLKKRRRVWQNVLGQINKDLKEVEKYPNSYSNRFKSDGVCNYLRRAGESDIDEVDCKSKRSMAEHYPEFARFKPEKTWDGSPYWWSRGIRGLKKRNEVVTKILENLEAEMQAFE